MWGWLLGALRHYLNRNRPQPLMQCLHTSWSACILSQQWCLNPHCSARRKCY